MGEEIDKLLQEYIHLSKYSRWREKWKRRESWQETIKRLHDFWTDNILDKLNNNEITQECYEELSKIINENSLFIDEKKVMPSMRSMMTAGKALAKDHTAGYNCSFIAVTHQAVFSEIFFLLLCGAGTGFSVERQYIVKLPEVSEEMYPTDTVLKIRDSKLGWATGLKELISMLYNGQIPQWDLSSVRPAGSMLKTFGGRASGPEPLNDLFKNIVRIFKESKGRKLSSIECYDIICYVMETVICGGVRRSAGISLSNLTDDRMRRAKDGTWWVTSPQRAMTNNSVAYTEKPDLDSFSKEWRTLYKSKSGERGIWNKVSAKKVAEKCGREYDGDYGTNPCFTGDMRLLTVDGYQSFKDLCDTEPYIINKHRDVSKSKVWCSGEKETVSINFINKNSITCTPNHIFLDDNNDEVEAKDLEGHYLHLNLVDSVTPSGAQLVYDFTEPLTNWGFVEGVLVHNCGETILRDNGSLCNLSEVIITPQCTFDDIKEKVRVATNVGTLQSTLTNFRFLRSIWKKNADEERLLGVSLTGIMDHIIFMNKATRDEFVTWSGDKNLDSLEKILKYLHDYSHECNKKTAKLLNINHSNHIGVVKPSGTVSLLTGTSSGIHPRYAKYYIRRVRNDRKDPLSQLMIDEGVPHVEDGDKFIFSFFVKSPNHSIIQEDIGAMEQLELWKIYKENWCDGNPSQTIYYTDDDYFAIADWLWKNWDSVGGLSFFPFTDSSEGVYKNAPLEAITEEEYKRLVLTFPKTIHWEKLPKYEKNDCTESAQTLACAGGACELT